MKILLVRFNSAKEFMRAFEALTSHHPTQVDHQNHDPKCNCSYLHVREVALCCPCNSFFTLFTQKDLPVRNDGVWCEAMDVVGASIRRSTDCRPLEKAAPCHLPFRAIPHLDQRTAKMSFSTLMTDWLTPSLSKIIVMDAPLGEQGNPTPEGVSSVHCAVVPNR